MSIGARIACFALVFVTAVLQVSIFWRIEIAGGTPDVLMVVVASIALLTGSIAGATSGFAAGVLLACVAALPLGPHALLATLIGYAIGRVGEVLVTDDHPVPPIVAAVLATLAIALGRPLVEFLLDPAVSTVDGLLAHAAASALLSGLVALPVFGLVRRTLNAAQSVGASLAGSDGVA